MCKYLKVIQNIKLKQNKLKLRIKLNVKLVIKLVYSRILEKILTDINTRLVGWFFNAFKNLEEKTRNN